MALLTQTATPALGFLSQCVIDVWASKNIALNPVSATSTLLFLNPCVFDVWAAKNITTNPVRVRAILGVNVALIPSSSKVVNGFFQNQTGAPIARLGYAIDRATGAFITSFSSDAVTGAFSFYAPSTNPVIIVLVPNSGDGRNSVVLDNIVPI